MHASVGSLFILLAWFSDVCGWSRFSDIPAVVRLVGAPSPTSGRVEVGYKNEWGTVCSEGFDSWAAKVVCRQLGYPTKNARVTLTSDGGGGGDIWIHGISCIGFESNLFQCLLRENKRCDHSQDVSVSCENGRLETDDRIPNGKYWGIIFGTIGGTVGAILMVCAYCCCRAKNSSNDDNTMQRSANNRAGSNQPVVYSTQRNEDRAGQVSTEFPESPYPVAPLLIPSEQPPSYAELSDGTTDLPPKYEDLFFADNSTRTDNDNSAHYTRDVRCLY